MVSMEPLQHARGTVPYPGTRLWVTGAGAGPSSEHHRQQLPLQAEPHAPCQGFYSSATTSTLVQANLDEFRQSHPHHEAQTSPGTGSSPGEASWGLIPGSGQATAFICSVVCWERSVIPSNPAVINQQNNGQSTAGSAGTLGTHKHAAEMWEKH